MCKRHLMETTRCGWRRQSKPIWCCSTSACPTSTATVWQDICATCLLCSMPFSRQCPALDSSGTATKGWRPASIFICPSQWARLPWCCCCGLLCLFLLFLFPFLSLVFCVFFVVV